MCTQQLPPIFSSEPLLDPSSPSVFSSALGKGCNGRLRFFPRKDLKKDLEKEGGHLGQKQSGSMMDLGKGGGPVAVDLGHTPRVIPPRLMSTGTSEVSSRRAPARVRSARPRRGQIHTSHTSPRRLQSLKKRKKSCWVRILMMAQ